MGVMRWEGRLRGSSVLGLQGRGGRDGGKKGEETIWFSCRWVKCGAGGREREEGRRGRGAAEDGGATERRWMGGEGRDGGQGLGGRRELGEKREIQRGRERDRARRSGKRQRPRVRETEMGEGEIWGRQRLVAEGSWRGRHTQREISRERRGWRQREEPRGWGRDGGWGQIGTGERMRGQDLGNRRKEETQSHPERGRRDRWGETDRGRRRGWGREGKK